MKVESLELRDFRSYENTNLSFINQVNVFVGKNGQGKSNILEAIELILSGDSFRPCQPDDFIRHQSANQVAIVKACVSNHDLLKNIDLTFQHRKRQIRLNGHRLSAGQLQKILASVTFTPDSLAIVKAGPQERRQLLDTISKSLEKHNVDLLLDFNKCLKARNKVLKQAIDTGALTTEMSVVLSSLTERFLPVAASVTFARIQTIKRLQPVLERMLRTILNDEHVDISVDYVISEKSAIAWSPNQVYDALKSRLRDLRAAELSSGQTLVGPHKHDVKFCFNGKDARYFCSQGQQRAIALAIKIAHIKLYQESFGEFPILLLDDVFSELDAEKQECLLGVLREMPAQIFLTTTEIEESRHFGLKDVKVFLIDKGRAGQDGISVSEFNDYAGKSL
jgi:DNA replication and repair protein RecF